MADRAVLDSVALTVVVPTRNRPAQLERCLAALQPELAAGDELVVVDSASSPPIALDGVRVVRSEVPGSARARNLGWRAASTSYVAFVDDDVRVLPGWRDGLVGGFENGAFVAGAVGVPAEQTGVEQPVAVTTLTAPTALLATTRGTLGATANLGVRVDAMQFVGGFDERLGPGTWTHAAEDLDLLDRLFGAGYTGWFAPEAAAVHEQWRGRRQLLALQWGYGIGQGARLWLMLTGSRKRRALMVLRDAVWDGDVRAGARSLRDGYQFGALVCGVRLLGTLLGFVRAAVVWR